MNMHSALLFVDVPGRLEGIDNLQSEEKWLGFLNNCGNKSQTNEKAQRLSENCWLIPLQSELSTLGTLLAEAKRFQLGCRVLFFEKEPQFIKS
jgi:hypothetical protein